MNFLALLLGLGVERLLTHLFHLREFRWLDPVFDWLTAWLSGVSRVAAVLRVIALTALIVLPVGLASVILSGALYQIPYFALAVFVLLFSLGPRDLQTEAEDYCAAVREEDHEEVRQVAREMWEGDPDEDPEVQLRCVQRAVYIQANNRIFAVVFWFVLLGPTGAWLFRVLDLLRRRLAFQYMRADGEMESASMVWAVRTLHGLLAWPPARLLMLGYALAGSFDSAISAWRGYFSAPRAEFFAVTNDLLDRVGHAAAVHRSDPGDEPVAAMRVAEAMGLVRRTLWWIWCPVIAILTLTDWLS
jgi:AmpE protein